MNKEEIKTLILKKIKQLHKKRENLKKHLELCESWKKYHHEADLLQSNIYKIKKGMKSISLFDWELNQEKIVEIDLKKKISNQISDLYKKSRKLKKGLSFVKQFIQKSFEDEKILEGFIYEIENSDDLEVNLRIYESLMPKKKIEGIIHQRHLPYKEFISKSGFKIWVGKSAANNEILTFQLGYGGDLWFHARDYSGSHVLVKTDGKEIDEITLQEAARLALKHSKGKNKNEGEVIYTFQKYVKKIKSKKGSVNISNAKVIFVRLS